MPHPSLMQHVSNNYRAVGFAYAQILRDRRLKNAQLVNRVKLLEKAPDLIFGQGSLVYGPEGITLGRQCFIDRGAMINCGTINGRQGFIRCGDNVEVGPYSVLWGHGGIAIGNNVHIGANVCITAHEALHIDANRVDDYLTPLDFFTAPVTIGDHVLICSGVQVIPGVKIGHHAMIGAGAVVTRDIPPYALAVGVPARPIRSIEPAEPLHDVAMR